MIKIKQYVEDLNPIEYKKHLRHASKYCNQDKSTAEDIVQESFERLLRSEVVAEYPNSYTGIAIMNETRRQFTKNRIFRLSEDFTDSAYVAEAAYTNILYDDSYLLAEAMELLPKKQREVLTTVLNEGSIVQAASLLNMNYDTAKATYRHAMLKVKEYLMQNNYEAQSGN